MIFPFSNAKGYFAHNRKSRFLFNKLMMKTNKDNQHMKRPAHIFDNVAWSKLSNSQKTKWLLGSMRMIDEDSFLHEYGSIESPDNNNQNKMTK